MTDQSLQDQLLDVQPELAAEVAETIAEAEEAPKKQKAARGKRYTQARSFVDRTKSYGLEEAVELVKRTSYGRFDSTLEMHVNLKREIRPVDVSMPFSTGKAVRVAIVDDALIADIESGKIEFDVLLTTPAYMPKLVKFARVLGPKGLMPNPKNGTVTSDPEAKKATLEKGSITLKTEKKAPLLHLRVGKKSQDTKEIVANIETLLRAININVVTKATLCGSMGPGVKLAFQSVVAL